MTCLDTFLFLETRYRFVDIILKLQQENRIEDRSATAMLERRARHLTI